MPQWAGSSWYELRYADPHNSEAFCAKENEAYWMGPRPAEHGPSDPGGVDLYVGGVEHAVLHLLYCRFWHKVLYDLGHVSSREPYRRLMNQGYIQAFAYTDTRGAYGLLAREVIGLLKHLQHAPGKTVILVGILEATLDDMKRTIWMPQMEGGKVGRELPGIVDQVMTLSLFDESPDGYRHNPESGQTRRLVCHAINPWGLPAKDRSGRLDLVEEPNLLKLIRKCAGDNAAIHH